jgi:RNA polymerase sigma factor (sigma-70 family)
METPLLASCDSFDREGGRGPAANKAARPLSHGSSLCVDTREQAEPPVEPTLIAALRRGSREAFARVYAAERGRLYGFLLRLCQNSELAADLFQNTWLKLAQRASSLREDTDVRAWLFTVARNEYRSHCRAQMVDLSRFLAVGREQQTWPEAPLPGERTAEIERLETALASLADADRELLLLVGVEGLELQQAAEVLGVSYAALRQRLARARSRLSQKLSDQGSETWSTSQVARCK